MDAKYNRRAHTQVSINDGEVKEMDFIAFIPRPKINSDCNTVDEYFIRVRTAFFLP